jgi:hypothetical protein
MVLPLVILFVLVKVAPPWPDAEARVEPEPSGGTPVAAAQLT